jgi:hypothetical protein
MKFAILAAFLMIVAITLFTQGKFGPGLLGVALAVFFFLRWWKGRAGKQTSPPSSAKPASPAPAAPAPAASSPSQPTPYQIRKANAGTLDFQAKGTSFNGRQNTLKKLDDLEDERYLGCSFGLEKTEYEGEPAIKVYAELMDDDCTEKEIGFVPHDLVPKVLAIFDRVFEVDVDVNGGYDDLNYGAHVTIYYDK